jgi:hypothetical protein
VFSHLPVQEEHDTLCVVDKGLVVVVLRPGQGRAGFAINDPISVPLPLSRFFRDLSAQRDYRRIFAGDSGLL